MQPLIGISIQREFYSRRWVTSVSGSYVQAVLRAGGVPVLLPVSLPPEDLAPALERVQGVILTGGPDINPAVYGRGMHPKVKGIDMLRDQSDMTLARAACDLQKPLLGICRGFQLLNVVFGGELYTDLNEQHDGLYHTCQPDLPYDLLAHTVRLAPGCRLAGLLQATEIEVNSLHHQGVRRPGDGLVVTATAPDGLVESVEIPDHPFGLAVQWHPELLPNDVHSQALFRAFIQAAAGHR